MKQIPMLHSDRQVLEHVSALVEIEWPGANLKLLRASHRGMQCDEIRHVAIYLADAELVSPFLVGRWFRRSLSLVHFVRRNVRNRMDVDAAYAARVNRLQSTLRGLIRPALNVTDLERRLIDFCKAQKLPIDLPSRLRKFFDEAGELAEAIARGDKEAARMEAADCGLVLTHIVHLLNNGTGDTSGSFSHVMQKKLKIVEERTRKGRRPKP